MFKYTVPVLLLMVACASTRQVPSTTAVVPLSNILGVRLDMPRDSVREVLSTRGTFVREELKRQEVWAVHDPHFSSLLIGYDRQWNVRYVTAIANATGTPLSYSDVVDVSAAERRSAGESYTYILKTGTPPHSIIAIGGPEHVTYLSLKKDSTGTATVTRDSPCAVPDSAEQDRDHSKRSSDGDCDDDEV